MKLNIGAGKRFKVPGWTTLDLDPRAHIPFDLYRLTDELLPLKDDSCDLVYSSHTIEHLPTDYGVALIYECYRVLKPGGVCRFTCPDFDLALEHYAAGDKAWFETAWVPEFKDYSIEQCFLTVFCSPISAWATGFLKAYTEKQSAKFEQWKDQEIRAIDWSIETANVLCEAVATTPGIAWPNHISPWNVEKFKQTGIPGLKAKRISDVIDFRPPHFDSTVPAASLFVEFTKP